MGKKHTNVGGESKARPFDHSQIKGATPAFHLLAGAFAAVTLWLEGDIWTVLAWWSALASWTLYGRINSGANPDTLNSWSAGAAGIRRVGGFVYVSGALWAFYIALYPHLQDVSILLLIFMLGAAGGALLFGAALTSEAIVFSAGALFVLAVKLAMAGRSELAALAAIASTAFFVFLRVSWLRRKTARWALRNFENKSHGAEGVKLYKAAIEHSPFGMCIMTLDYRIIRVNTAFCTMMGYSADELIGWCGADIGICPDDISLVREAYNRLFSEKSEKERLEVRYLRSDGATFWTFSERSLLREGGSGDAKYIIVQLTDIDKRKKAEAKLSRAIKQKELAVETGGLGEFVIRYKEGKGREIEWIDIMWNNALYAIFGVNRGAFEPTADTVLGAIHCDDLARAREELTTALLEERDKTIELRIIRPTGETRYLKTTIAVYHDLEERCRARVGVVIDRTDEMASAKSLEEALACSELAATVAGLGVSHFDANSGKSEWDDRLIKIYGVDPKSYDFFRKSRTKLIHPDDRERVLDEERSALRLGKTRSSIRHKIIRPDGVVRHLSATRAIRYEKDGSPQSTITAVLDVTEYVELAEEIEREKGKLRQTLEERSLAIDIAGLGEFRRDLSTGRGVWSKRLYEIFGVDSKTFEVDGYGFIELIHPDDRAYVESQLAAEAVGGEYGETPEKKSDQISFRIVSPAGEIRYLTAHTHTLREDGVNGRIVIHGLVRDRTEEVRLHNELLKEKRELSTALTKAKLAVDLAGLGVYEYDQASDKATWDQRLCDINGIDAHTAEMLGQRWLGTVHPQDKKRVETIINKPGIHQGPLQLNFRIVRPTGEVRHLRASGRVERNEAGLLIKALGVVWDVTDRVTLLEKIERERSRLEATLKAIGDAVIRTDVNGGIEYMNPAALRIAGYTEAKGAGAQNFLSCFTLSGEGREFFESAFVRDDANASERRGHDSGAARNVPARLFHEDGAVSYVEMSAEPLTAASGGEGGLVIALHDVTRLKDSETSLAESRSLLKTALDHAPVGLSVIDRAGRFSFVNRELSNITGYARTDLLEKHCAPLFSKLPAEMLDAIKFDGTGPPQDDALVFEGSLERADGATILARFSLTPVVSENGELLCTVAQVQDVTEENRRIAELHEAKELAHITLVSVSEGIVRTDEQGTITLCNPEAAQIIGLETPALIGRPFAEMFHFFVGGYQTRLDDPVKASLARGEAVRIQSRLRLSARDGKLRRVNLSVSPMSSGDGDFIGAVVLIQDASEMAQLMERLAHQAYTDELTGIGNRRAFETRINECVEAIDRRTKTDFLLFIDLDYFKTINDTCGHTIGDQLLCDLAQVFLSQVRENDFVARVGGDEFGIILRSCNEESAMGMAQKIVDSVSAYRLVHEDVAYQIGASIGITKVRNGLSVSTLMIEADTACYAAKRAGRGRYCVYHPNDTAIAETRINQNWFQRIQHALEDERFNVFLQQIVTRDRQPVGFEALLRLKENNRTVGPGAFIETARRHDMLPKFDRYMLESVIGILNGENEHSSQLAGKYISVNLSASSVADPVFRDWVEDILERNRHLTQSLWFELTESDRMKWTEEEISFLSSVRQRGIRLYFDDFGTGYNSFDVLKRVSVDGLKLDHSVIRNIISSPIDQSLILASLNIARNLGVELVAEGVEDERTLDFLASLGVKKFQGFLFHQPEEAIKALAVLRNGGKRQA